ncbi:hypothetical protein BJ138DRAFT_527505 [Hygrophoropsis aurantiaca]|uniref:Uncharacterized protein n=1 Tax=Hygrophoropsis aurantiaca TaxID=72124 RepID=A0ACB8AKJ3_9AGAM|nr:hypothetical protein BJ138DRAFT_527505 [Hygrophoropsis aurantiaca]
MFQVFLLVSCICVLVVAILYTFYWNRFVALLIGLVLRVKYWNQGGSSIWIQIGSIHFSILAGRILLKDVRYHSSNQTIKVVKAQIVWRYWIRLPATEDDLNRAHVGGDDFNQEFPFPSCRIKVSIQGLEWFLYNRTAAYDYIISQMQSKDHPTPADTEPNRMFSRTSGFEVPSLHPPSVLPNLKAPPFIHAFFDWIKRQMPYLDPKDLLPISLEGFKGAITCGNASTPNLLVAEFHRAEGTFGIVPSRSKCDLYKQLLNLKFQNALIHLVENEEYHETMPTVGRIVREQVESSKHAQGTKSSYLSYRTFAKIWRRLSLYSTLFGSRHPLFGSHIIDRKAKALPMRKSQKSMDEETHVGADFTALEYAIERRIIEAPLFELSYYADVVGDVPAEQDAAKGIGLESFDIGNGDLPPEWGIDLVIRSGTLRYGPWADRQRVHLQRAMFPPTYHDLEPSTYLKPGDKRAWTAMKVFIELRESTSLDIPFREASKNWQWDGLSNFHRRKKREPALMHLIAGDSSSISYVMPMVIGPEGYESRLEVHLDTIAVTSSLNDIKILVAESCRVHAELPSPVKWDAERRWSFAVSLRQPVIYIFRDHINMFTDISRDWTSGPPSDWNQFIPMIYSFNLDLHYFELNLYANDQNIIDKPLIREENAMVTIRAPRLSNHVTIPSNKYRPDATTIPFTLNVSDVLISLSLPKWNTQFLYAPGHEHRVLHADSFRVNASYHYFADVHPEHIEQLKLDIKTSGVAFKALGWSIRYFMVLRDNYFGSFTHFSTLYEYLEKRGRQQVAGDPIELKYRPGKANMLQVELAIVLEQASIALPAGLPGCEKRFVNGDQADDIGTSVVLVFPELQLDFRLHDYFMEMSLNIDDISGVVLRNCSENLLMKGGYQTHKDMILIDSIDITANRLFGPQPRTRTYVCIWEIRVGDMKALVSAFDVRVLMAAANTFRLNFTDLPNAPASEFGVPVDPDVTFVRFSLGVLNVTWLARLTAVNLTLPRGLSVHTNDLEGNYCGKVISLRLPYASLKVLLTPGTSRKVWTEAAEFVWDVNLDLYSPCRWAGTTNEQAKFLQEQDAATQRVQLLFNQFMKYWPASTFRQTNHRNGLHLPPLRPPRFSHKTWPEDHSSAQLQSAHAKSRWSKVAHLSESEGEENISEAVRDARLRKSRLAIPTPLRGVDDNEQSVSGDESDDEDLTSSDSSDSECSLHGAELDKKAILLRYHGFVNQYKELFLATPSQWNPSPFVLAKDVKVSKATRDPQFNDSTSPPSIIQSNNINSRNLRIDSTKGIEVHVCPLLLLALTNLREEVELQDFTPELALDALMVGFLGNFSDAPNQPSTTALDINLTSIRVRITQQVVLPDDKVNPSTTHDKAAKNCDPMTLIDIYSTGFYLRTDSIDNITSLRSLQTGFTDISANLEVIKTSIPSYKISSELPKFSLLLAGLRGELTPGSVHISLEEITGQIGGADPDYIAASCRAFHHDAKELSKLQRAWQQHAQFCTQDLIYQALLLTKDTPTVDLLSTTQPSYLVQTGRPEKLRSNPTFKFLFHLRTSLSLLSVPMDRGPLALKPDADVRIQEFKQLISSCLNSLNLDVDSGDSSVASDLELWSAAENLSPDSPKPSYDTITIRINLLDVAILDHGQQPSSQLLLKTLALQTRSSKIVQNSQAGNVLSRPLLHVATHELITQTAVVISVDDLSITISPYLMNFAQQILRVYNRFQQKISSAQNPLKTTGASYLVLALFLGRFRFKAGAASLILEFGGSNFNTLLSHLERADSAIQTGSQSTNLGITLDDIFLRALSKPAGSAPTDQDILASLAFTKAGLSLLMYQELSTIKPQISLALDTIVLSIPRSALRLYRFIEEWRADFLPGAEATAQALFSDFRDTQMKRVSADVPSLTQRNGLNLQFSCHVSAIEISLQVMRGTWLSWNIHDSTAFFTSLTQSTPRKSQSFGMRLGSQALSISYRSQSTDDVTYSPRVKLSLPTLSLSGTHTRGTVKLLTSLEYLNILLKPSHWDTLLVVQQKFGQDFTDLMDLIQETRQKRTAVSPQTIPSSNSLFYSTHVKVKGFRIGLEGPSSTFYLECEDVGGDITTSREGLSWRIGLWDLALSLAPRATVISKQHGFNRNHRSVFVTIDLRASAKDQKLQVTIPKIQAVMQPSSIGELGDFIDYQQAEMLVKQEQRAAELAAFKEKTQSVLRTFDVKIKDSRSEPGSSWLNEHTIDVTVENIGVAFPLTLDQDLELPRVGSREMPSIRAFLFAVRRIKFGAQRGEAGQMTTRDLSFQFVSSFRQSFPDDFCTDAHPTCNRLLYPQMTAQVRYDHALPSRRIWISGSVSGFILDLDSSIPDYVFSLIDVYRQGRERMARLAGSNPRAMTPLISEALRPSSDLRQIKVPTSSIFASLVFQSGEVHVRNIGRTRTRSFSSDEEIRLPSDAESIKLPVVSVWAEYRASAAVDSDKIHSAGTSMLIFKSTIHSSQNTLRPTLLPFITEIVDFIQVRMRKSSRHNTALQPLLPPALDSQPSTSSSRLETLAETSSSLQVNFSLRIDKSMLELTCLPDVNVVAALRWDSGGFVVNISPGAHRVTFSGSVDGLTTGLKHGFLSDDCVSLDARNLAFALTFAKTELGDGALDSFISLVVGMDLSGAVRFSRLQDILCFKAVWLDRIPLFVAQPPVTTHLPPQSPPAISPSSSHQQPKQEVTTAILVKIRQIRVDVDLGQSISIVGLELDDAIIRTRFSETSSEVSLSVAEVTMLAKGNVSGRIHVPDCVFQTIRRNENILSQQGNGARMLELSMTSGPLNAELESDHQKLMLYRAEPVEIAVHDDWSSVSSAAKGEDQPVLLAFTVSGTDITVVATIATIPKLLLYANKFKANVDAQREGASRESVVFRSAQSPKPDNPLSEVASAMLHSARNRFKEADADLSYVIRQHLSFRLSSLRLILFPRMMSDMELARFMGSNVHASLDRIVRDGLPSWREVHLSFTNMAISKFSQHHQFIPSTVSASSDKVWLDSLFKNTVEAIIVGLPAMRMHMVTNEVIEEPSTCLDYDFFSEFARHTGDRNLEDIYITLNMSLYSWLTGLRKNLSREMEQVQGASDWRSTAPGNTPALSSRKKVAEVAHNLDTMKDNPTMDMESPRGLSEPVPSVQSNKTPPFTPSIALTPSAMLTSRSSSALPESNSHPHLSKTVLQTSSDSELNNATTSAASSDKKPNVLVYRPNNRKIERLTMRQLGEATPDVMHPFFMKKAGFNLEDSLPQYVHEYATIPLEEIMEALLHLYSKQLRTDKDISRTL